MSETPDIARLLSDLAVAAENLADVIRRENTALDRRDTAAVVALGSEKTPAARQFASRFSSLREASNDFRALSADDRQYLAAVTDPVAALVDENANRLRVAVEVGRRVMSAVSSAVRAMSPSPGTYSANGAVAGAGPSAAAGQRSVAISINTSL